MIEHLRSNRPVDEFPATSQSRAYQSALAKESGGAARYGGRIQGTVT